MKRAVLLVGALCAAAALLAACGGSDPELVTKEELVTRADEACTEAQRRFAEIQAEPPSGAQEAAEQTDDLAGALGEELDELEGMEAPAELQPAYERYVAAVAQARDLVEDGADAAEDQDSRGYGKLQSDLAAGKLKRRGLAAKLGFRKCSPLAG
jgi:hypothetical protein